ncbi:MULTISPECIES: hypothetical protein [unclassified Mesorhizobium]|nr:MULTISPECIES: hypothetical protein [unclassified Mesorhizobium]TPJ84332.1 hypothetical protein FJ422_14795 [Mesorhizobium sp. B2-6-3]TPI54442.1 hypothetical protein FJW11_10315 [Mesorhizobium sp. B3-1-1]TPJ53617.1 hypothetical protein FJ426_11270 [Mesorhizobium sp. B2-6-4]TPJ70022.1 hypothetical protein FJ462_09045 [Mesorhizobium sp. B2-6-7]TPK01760.1 hypothetical protein FJ491_08355 [Mesorhizobium sp. B2-5-10]
MNAALVFSQTFEISAGKFRIRSKNLRGHRAGSCPPIGSRKLAQPPSLTYIRVIGMQAPRRTKEP